MPQSLPQSHGAYLISYFAPRNLFSPRLPIVSIWKSKLVHLGDRFAGQIEASTARISNNPLMPRCFYRECRRVKADRFPYVVIYRVKDEVVQILAVMHTSRHPDYWKSRLKNE